MEPNLEELKKEYLDRCAATGTRPRACLEKYRVEDFTYFISILKTLDTKEAAD